MYQRILVPIDGSSTAQKGLQEAVHLAKATGGRLKLVHVVDDLSLALAMDAYAGAAGGWVEQLRADGEQLLAQARDTAQAAGLEVETALVESDGRTVHDIVNAEAAAWPAELIVVGTHGRRGLSRLVLGSSAEHILRFAPTPVLLVRAPETPPAEPATPPQTTRVSLPVGALSIE